MLLNAGAGAPVAPARLRAGGRSAAPRARGGRSPTVCAAAEPERSFRSLFGEILRSRGAVEPPGYSQGTLTGAAASILRAQGKLSEAEPLLRCACAEFGRGLAVSVMLMHGRGRYHSPYSPYSALSTLPTCL